MDLIGTIVGSCITADNACYAVDISVKSGKSNGKNGFHLSVVKERLILSFSMSTSGVNKLMIIFYPFLF